MKKILHIVSSINGEASFSNRLSNAIILKLKVAYPYNQVHHLNLSETPFPYLETIQYGAFFTPTEHQTADQKEAIVHSNEAIKELKDTDIIVIGVPLYNFGIPATLKAWIDQIVRVGETFTYADGTSKGLLQNKKVYLAIASGAVYSEGPYKSYDFTENYLRKILGFIGLTDITVFRVEGTRIPEIKETTLSNAFATVNESAL
jgi:FMN-dependent NADH-azoreductase